MYQALYRTLRPEVFADLLGQEHIIKILTNQLGNDTVSHAYLFCGTRGTGKTTTARLLAKGINCIGEGEKPCGICSNCESIRKGTFVDVIEIDAASNRGIENIRELRESVKYPPAVGRRKVYIIDEVHMLSNEAFNALLKTLEEPPENVMFILATTEPNKLPATVLSRCMRLDFKRIPEKILEARMMEICLEKGVKAELSAVKLIAGNADGSVRDGLSILDQLLAGGTDSLTRAQVLELLGANSQDALIQLSGHIHEGNIKEIFLNIDFLLQEGRDARQLIKDLIYHYRALLITQFIDNPENLLNISMENIQRIKELGQSMTTEDVSRGIIEFSKTNLDARYSTQPRILLEITCIKLAQKAENHLISKTPKSVEQNENRDIVSKVVKKSETEEIEKESLVEKTETKKPDDIAREQSKSRGSEEIEKESLFEKTEIKKSDDIAQEHDKSPGSEEIEKTIANQSAGQGRDQENLDLWEKALTRLEKEKATFRVARDTTYICEVDNDCVVVEANSEFMLCRLEDNRTLIEDALEEITGQKRSLVSRISGESLKTDELISAEATKKDVQQNFKGISIEIEEKGE